MADLKIEYVKLSEIKPYKGNAKTHPKEQVEQIKKSILEMGDGDVAKGFLDPIGIWHDEIVEGHGRYFAAQELGLDTVPVIRLDGLTDEQRRAYTLIHNKLTMNSDFDFDILSVELDDILDIDMSDFGFSDEFSNVSAEDYDTEFSLPDGDKPEICTMTFTLHQNQKALIDYAMSQVENNIAETFGNTNKNGNALYEVVRQWAERKKLK